MPEHSLKLKNLPKVSDRKTVFMSKMMNNRKPPLPRSPIGLRSRSFLRSNTASLQTTPGSMFKSMKPSRCRIAEEEPDIWPEYRLISREFHALAQKFHDEFGQERAIDGFTSGEASVVSIPLFGRGRLYDAYSERRNERLKRKKWESESAVKNTPYALGVTTEGSKKRGVKSVKRSVSTLYERSEPRYMLRSMTKENKRPPPLAPSIETSAVSRKTTARKGRKN